MAIFTIYRYEIKDSNDIFCALDKQNSSSENSSPYDVFESCMGNAKDSLMGGATDKDNDMGIPKICDGEEHHTMIEQHMGHIIMFLLQANKTKTIYQENWEKRKEPNYPDCRIMIDNRPGSHLIIIEKKSTVFANPDKAMEILQDLFGKTLADYGFKIHSTPLTKKESFWDAVNDIREKFGDKVNRVQFDFKSDGPTTDDGSFTYKIMQWARSFSVDNQLTMNIGDDSKLKKVERDLTRMSELCCKSEGYNLTVRFNNFGLYRYGQDLKAQYGMDDETIDRFVNMKNHPQESDLFGGGR